ncbi:MAG TPA: carboxypeptidase regulatory-like domain-containing protein [Blastocatellia bacterium]|nr:carboxypeptidase regulatory-like domain-containing protein [Blastocatellia bacterium]
MVLCFSTAAFAQTTSTITGTIRDQSGAIIVGAKITAKQVETNSTRTAVSDAAGRYVLPEMRIGLYQIRAEMNNFRPVEREFRLTLGETATFDLEMVAAGVDVQIDVTSNYQDVNTQSQELSFLVGERAIRELPLNGRNYTDLAFLQPGVIAYPHRDGGSVVAHGTGASINGQDPRSNVYLLDGTLQNDITNGPASSAAGTALGTESIREFRVETNSYSAEFGRNSGGQINAISKSGGNSFHGSLYHFLRNDNLDARNFFDRQPIGKPEFKRNQFGATLGGPIKTDRTFFFGSYEGLRERLGRTIGTFVPDANARQGILPSGTVTVSPVIRPYLDLYPLPNGAPIGNTGISNYYFGFRQTLDQNFTSGRVDHKFNDDHQSFVRYTLDDAEQLLPTDYPQFPRTFFSRNQYTTLEHTWLISANTVSTSRFGFSRTRLGQNVEANLPTQLPPFVPGRQFMGNIDVGGLLRIGPQNSANLRLVQNVFSFSEGLVHTRGKHLLKFGGLVERYQDNMVNPTFSLGIYSFADLSSFLRNVPRSFVGLTPDAQFDRYWRFNLLGGYVQDDYKLTDRLTVNLGLRYEYVTVPLDRRDVSLPNVFTDTQLTPGPLYQNPTTKNISPRIGFAWDIFGNGKTSLRGGWGIYFNTTNQQNLIVTVTNPPATPRPVIQNPAFPNPNFATAGISAVRPIEWNLKNPNVHQYNLNLQRQLWFDTVVTIGYAGSRGIHLLRNADVNTSVPVQQADGTWFFPNNAPRRNPRFGVIELKTSDGNSWYNALLFEVRKRFSRGVDFQSSYTFSRNIDTTQASTFFSDATNATVSALPEIPGLNYNKGLADYHAKHNWVFNFNWELPLAKGLQGASGKVLGGWNLMGIAQMRSGNPLTVFLQANRSQSKWQPSASPLVGPDRPSLAPGYTYDRAVLGDPNQYFDPKAFVLQPSGTLGNTGRNAFIGPNLRTFDLALVKNTRITERFNVQFRVESFNLFNRANFSNPGLLVYAGTPAANNAPSTAANAVACQPFDSNGNPDPTKPCQKLASFGIIRQTTTSARQIQLGLRLLF